MQYRSVVVPDKRWQIAFIEFDYSISLNDNLPVTERIKIIYMQEQKIIYSLTFILVCNKGMHLLGV